MSCATAACYQKVRVVGNGRAFSVSRRATPVTPGGTIFSVDTVTDVVTVNGTLAIGNTKFPDITGLLGQSLVIGNNQSIEFSYRVKAPDVVALNRFNTFDKVDGSSVAVSSFGAVSGSLQKNDSDFITEVTTDSLAVGTSAAHNATGVSNTSIGFSALGSLTTATENVAVGTNALASLVSPPGQSTAVGAFALENATAGENTAFGQYALRNLTTGFANTALGEQAALALLTGVNNVAVGRLALQNVQGDSNVALGAGAMVNGTTGDNNVSIGRDSLFSNSGNNNVAVGRSSLQSLQTGSGNTCLGYNAGINLTTNDSDNVLIASNGTAGDNNVTRIGPNSTTCFVGGISGVTTGGAAVAVLVDANGQLGTISSSKRYKKNITDIDTDYIEKLKSLEVKSFSYKNNDEKQFGLIAEEVENVFPEMVVHNEDGEAETIQYHKLVPLLLKYCQYLERKI